MQTFDEIIKLTGDSGLASSGLKNSGRIMVPMR